MFVCNLSCRIPRRDLWEAFNSYGKVKDVFIKYTRLKSYTFAFVQYKSEEECTKVVEEGNNRKCRFIAVKIASYGWKSRKRSPFAPPRHFDNGDPTFREDRIMGIRSYYDVLRRVAGPIVEKMMELNDEDAQLPIDPQSVAEEKFIVIMPNESWEWLKLSVMGRVTDSSCINDFMRALEEEEYSLSN